MQLQIQAQAQAQAAGLLEAEARLVQPLAELSAERSRAAEAEPLEQHMGDMAAA